MATPAPHSPSSKFSERGDVVGAAFHGTYLEFGKIIAKDGFQKPFPNERQRMGAGVYFWENSLRAGQRWADRHYRDKPNCVIQARIRLSRHMNLGVSEHQEAFESVARGLLKASGEAKVYEAQVYNFLAQKGWIHTARRIHKYGEQKALVPEAEEKWTEGYSDTMICVYLTSLIEAPCIVWPPA